MTKNMFQTIDITPAAARFYFGETYKINYLVKTCDGWDAWGVDTPSGMPQLIGHRVTAKEIKIIMTEMLKERRDNQ